MPSPGNPIKHTSQAIDNWSFDETYQEATILPVGEDLANGVLRRLQVDENGNLKTSGAAAVGGATETKQDSQITLETQLISLIGTLQELAQRLAPLASAMNAGAPALRTIPIASVSTAVTGSVTATVASTSITNFGTGIPASEMAHDINNQTAILANINNASA